MDFNHGNVCQDGSLLSLLKKKKRLLELLPWPVCVLLRYLSGILFFFVNIDHAFVAHPKYFGGAA